MGEWEKKYVALSASGLTLSITKLYLLYNNKLWAKGKRNAKQVSFP